MWLISELMEGLLHLPVKGGSVPYVDPDTLHAILYSSHGVRCLTVTCCKHLYVLYLRYVPRDNTLHVV